jgi:hypothetical protein
VRLKRSVGARKARKRLNLGANNKAFIATKRRFGNDHRGTLKISKGGK